MSYTYTFNFDKMRVEHYIALIKAGESPRNQRQAVEVIAFLCNQNIYPLPVSELAVLQHEFIKQYEAWQIAQNFMSDFQSGWQMGLSGDEKDTE